MLFKACRITTSGKPLFVLVVVACCLRQKLVVRVRRDKSG